MRVVRNRNKPKPRYSSHYSRYTEGDMFLRTFMTFSIFILVCAIGIFITKQCSY